MSTTTLHRIQQTGPWVLIVVLAAGLSLVASLWPLPVAAIIGFAVLCLVAAHMLWGLRFWQILTAIALCGYAAMNYGFSNFTLPRMPLPVGHLLMFGGLVLALPGRGFDVRMLLREPVAWCWLGLASMTLLHLIDQIPRYGAYAIRDSSFIFEGIFLLSGFLWARSRLGLSSMVRTLVLIFGFNLVYSFTYAIGEPVTFVGESPDIVEPTNRYLMSISPTSGVFQEIPLLGTYWNASIFLVSGALFVFLMGGRVLKGWPPIVVAGFAFLQLAWSLIFQARTAYLSLVAAGIILVLMGERRKVASAVTALAIGLLLIGLLGMLGIGLQGRLGRLTPGFVLEHFRSLFLSANTPGVETAHWRVQLMPQVIARWTSSASTIVVGEGFGQALIEWDVPGQGMSAAATCTEPGASGCGVQVRQPHNTHLTALMRLGMIGLLFWGAMHARITYLLIRGARAAPISTIDRAILIWALTFYTGGMIWTTFQPWTEFSHGAIPFYTLIGFAIGLEHHWRHRMERVQGSRPIGEAPWAPYNRASQSQNPW